MVLSSINVPYPDYLCKDGKERQTLESCHFGLMGSLCFIAVLANVASSRCSQVKFRTAEWLALASRLNTGPDLACSAELLLFRSHASERGLFLLQA